MKVSGDEIVERKGERKSIGYRRTPSTYEYIDHHVAGKKESSFYLTTDGYVDQNGGEKDFSFGKKNFVKVVKKASVLPFDKQKALFISELQHYMGDEMQRDDITVLGFKV